MLLRPWSLGYGPKCLPVGLAGGMRGKIAKKLAFQGHAGKWQCPLLPPEESSPIPMIPLILAGFEDHLVRYG